MNGIVGLNRESGKPHKVRPEHEAMEKRTWFLDRSITKLNNYEKQINAIYQGYNPSDFKKE